MANLELSYPDFKNMVQTKSLRIQYVNISGSYYLFAFDGAFSISTTITQSVETANALDFETNFLPLANLSVSNIENTIKPVGSTVPTTASLIAGSDGTNLRSISTDTSGRININSISGAMVLPTGASTSAKQDIGNSNLSSIDSKIPSGLTISSTRLLTDNSGVTQPISAVSLPLALDAATATNQVTGNSTLNTISGKLPTLGQKNSAGSISVVLSSDQSTIAITPASDISPAVQNITTRDITTLPITGANGQVFSVGSATANSFAAFSLSSIETVSILVGGIWTGTVTIEGSLDGMIWTPAYVFQLGTSNVSSSFTGNFLGIVSTSGLINLRIRASSAWTGTATVLVKQTLNANSMGSVVQAGAPWSQNLTQVNSSSISLGQKVSTASLPIVISSDQSPVAVTGSFSLPTGAATALNQTNASQKTQVVDSSGNIISSTSTGGKQRLDVNLSTIGLDGSTAPTYSNLSGGIDSGGNQQALAVDTTGNINTVGNIASGATDSGNPVKIGAVYNTTDPSITNGQRVNLQTNYHGHLAIQFRNNFTNVTGNSTTTIKSGAGILHSVNINNNTTGGVITIYDNTAASGTKIFTFSIGSPSGGLLSTSGNPGPFNTGPLGLEFSTGLTVVMTGSTSNNCTFIYR